MIEAGEWQVVGGGLLAVGAIAAHAGLLLRVYIRHRTRLQVERERSARITTRAAGIARMAGGAEVAVRVHERDYDGHRIIELGGWGARDRDPV